MAELFHILQRANIPHSEHTIRPFIGDLEPDANPTGNVITIGSYSMRHIAKQKGWVPGCFDLEHFTYDQAIKLWPGEMLNEDSIICPLHECLDHFGKVEDDGLVFWRPIADSKAIAGAVVEQAEIAKDIKNTKKLRNKKGVDPYGLKYDTMMMLSPPRNIAREYRFWVVDGVVVTGSLYKMGGRVIYKNEVDPDIMSYISAQIQNKNPSRAFVIDVALMRNESVKIIEVNNFNSAGFYAADMTKIVGAIEGMVF